MKNLFNLKSFVSNPSYLGADRLWDNMKGCREDVGIVRDYDGI